jgi:hypothetical protein
MILAIIAMCCGIAYGAFERGRRVECDNWLNWIEHRLWVECPESRKVSLLVAPTQGGAK